MKELDPSEEVIFNAAQQFADAEKLRQYLDLACEGKPEMRRRIEGLLANAPQADSFFGRNAVIANNLFAPAAHLAPAQANSRVEEQPGSVIGRYKLMEKIGEGGCGMVYVAEQTEPVRRRVALKVIKLGMDTRSVVARFEAERQALAMMDHPNIAKVLDAGATDTGRPYFVMELVRGVKITEFCDQNQLPTQERLKLFIEVCRAVQHAHQKGIIHRDLKPSNILVTVNDGVPVPKVIDFGIAKATQGDLTDKTVYTQFQQLIGTPAYMSPEQAEMTSVDINTRTDIYGLGVLLYELLTGKTPFEAKELLEAGLDEMRRTIREREPLRPSTRLNTLVEAELRTAAKARQTEPPKLLHLVRGDLDWIVMKCLEKDRAHRYDTANGLAMDLQRHLSNEPVVARPPSAAYRFQKLVRRNKLVVGAAGAVAVVLLFGGALSTFEAFRARRAERLATEKSTVAQEQRQRAEGSESAARQEAYASDINLAQRALAEDNFGLARKLLERYRPEKQAEGRKQKAESDLRGWEWRYLWQQCTSDALLKLWQSKSGVQDLAISRDGKWLAVGEIDEGAGTAVLDISNLGAPWVITNLYPTGLANLAFSPEPLLAFCGDEHTATNWHQSVHLWNSQTTRKLFDLPPGNYCAGLAFSRDGRSLFASAVNPMSAADGQLTLWRIPEGTLLTNYTAFIPWPEYGNGYVAVDPNLKSAAICGAELQLIDLSNGQAALGCEMPGRRV